MPKARAVSVFTLTTQKSAAANENEIVLKLNKNHIEQFSEDFITLEIPIDKSKKLKLSLYAVEDSAPDIRNNFGEKIQPLESKHFRGVVSDDPNSIVALSVFINSVQLIISDNYGNYSIGPIKGQKEYIFYEDPSFVGSFNCLASPANSVKAEFKKEGQNQKNRSLQKCVKVHVVTDYVTWINVGGVGTTQQKQQNVSDFVTSMFNAVATIYQLENIPIELSQLVIWQIDDPYGAESNVVGALNYLTANFGANNIQGNLLHLVSAKSNSGSFAGIGWLLCGQTCAITKTTVLCSDYAYAVSQTQLYTNNFPTYSWSVNVFAHEMGHNMGSPHTHDCQWGAGQNQAIDSCLSNWPGGCADPGDPPAGGGTIMSYCQNNPNVGINLANGFGLEVGNHIRGQYANASLNCLTDCSISCPASLAINSGLVDGVYQSSGTITLNSAGDNNLMVISSTILNALNVEVFPSFSVNTGSSLILNIAPCDN